MKGLMAIVVAMACQGEKGILDYKTVKDEDLKFQTGKSIGFDMNAWNGCDTIGSYTPVEVLERRPNGVIKFRYTDNNEFTYDADGKIIKRGREHEAYGLAREFGTEVPDTTTPISAKVKKMREAIKVIKDKYGLSTPVYVEEVQ